MSRIGKLPITIPSGVNVTIDGRQAKVTGPKGELAIRLPNQVTAVEKEGTLRVKPGTGAAASQYYGLARTMLFNAVQGVSEGFERKLEIHGVGFKAQVSGQKLTLNLGYSHPIEYNLPAGTEAKVEGNVITVSGIDKQLVGQAAAEIRQFRKPEPYKGKGIKFAEEHVRRKAGKAAAAAGGAK